MRLLRNRFPTWAYERDNDDSNRHQAYQGVVHEITKTIAENAEERSNAERLPRMAALRAMDRETVYAQAPAGS